MIFYNKPLRDFLASDASEITDYLSRVISHFFQEECSDEEKASWIGTIHLFQKLFSDGVLPMDAGLALEYNIPRMNNRVDCIITGKDEKGHPHAILVELKGWKIVEKTHRPGKVRTWLLGKMRDEDHPSMQVKWYFDTLSTTQTYVWSGNVSLHPCAFLYNCETQDVINDPSYKKYTSAAPAFCKGEDKVFISFIKQFIKTGDSGKALEEIDNSRREVSNRLVDAITAMRNGNEFFPLSPEQESYVERIINAVDYQEKKHLKIILVIEGGPGTGKSVIAFKTLCDLILRTKQAGTGQDVRYFTKTRPPKSMINNSLTDANIEGLSSYLAYPSRGALKQGIHVSLVDEAHRLDGSKEDQLDLIVRNSDVSVFFTDQRQIVSVDDIGTLENIHETAKRYNAKMPDPYKLSINFRVSITESIEHLLQYPGSRDIPLPPQDEYDFRVFDDPVEMYQTLKKHDVDGQKSRMVAGYTRIWQSKFGKNIFDWTLEESPNFRFKWNIFEDDDDSNWATRQGLERIGCIHSCQGMEFDYIGVIISKDISIGENGVLEFHPEYHSNDDIAIKKENCIPISEMNADQARLIPELLRNAYFVLLTRGMKGCYVYIEGSEADSGVMRMRDYFKRFEANRRTSLP